MNNNVKPGLRKATLVIMAAGIINTSLTSCSSMSDSTKTKLQGTSFGALAGGLVGAGLGLAAGGDTKAVLIGAAAGAVLGGIGGYAWGHSIVKEKNPMLPWKNTFQTTRNSSILVSLMYSRPIQISLIRLPN